MTVIVPIAADAEKGGRRVRVDSDVVAFDGFDRRAAGEQHFLDVRERERERGVVPVVHHEISVVKINLACLADGKSLGA